jgi:hypothetical protein
MSITYETRLMATVEQARRGYDMERGGADYDGTRPCLPSEVLAKVASKALLRVRVAKDEAEAINPTQQTHEQTRSV